MSIDAMAGTDGLMAALARPDNHKILDALPAAIYATDAEGVLTFFNRAAEDLAGRTPRIGIDKWCVTHRLYRTDGSFLPHEECPMAIAIRERRPVRNVEAVAERPDGRRIPMMPFPTPIFDEDGVFVGAVNMLVDISQLKVAETSADRRADEQAALYQFTDKLYRAASIEDVYAAALDAIVGGLRCDRASILLFDEAGVMRFVAWRGLSETYRKAVDGHSPWAPGDTDPTPIFVEDIIASSQPDHLKRVVTTEGISALGFIPLVANGHVIGKFMTYHDRPQGFSESEVALAVTIARQLGFAVERRRADSARALAQDAQQRSVDRLALATSAGRVGLWDWDIGANHISWTDSLYGIHGLDKATFVPTFEDWFGRIHPDDRERVSAALRRTLEADEPYQLEMRCLRPDGSFVWVYANATSVRVEGKPVRLVGSCVDITERKQSEAQRDLLLAELSHRVKNTLATVISIAHQSFARERGFEEARRRFESRIRALAQTHTRLAESSWIGVNLETLLRDELAPYRLDDGGNVQISGPRLDLTPRQAIMLGMGFHELATNAAKYGALSSSHGRVEVNWQQSGDEVAVTWVETGGPTAASPQPNGFGRILLERALAADLRGSVQMDFAPSGLACTIRFPLNAETPN